MMTKKSLLFPLFLLLLVLVCSCSNRNEITNIVYHTEGGSNEQLAAKEIQRYLYLRSRKLVEIKSIDHTDEIKDGNIVVGTILCKNILDVTEDLGQEGFIVKKEENKIFVAGLTDMATLYGAYRFAELLGVRFYLHGDVIPDDQFIEIIIPEVNEVHRPLFDTRGIQPFHDFPEGPDWWSKDAYKAYFAQMAKMRMNFFGLHTYPEGGPHAEPSVWIGLKEDVKENGDVQFSYRTTYANTEREGHWGYAPMKTSDFVAGASLLFEEEIYGNEILEGLTSQSLSPEECNELFNRQGRMFNDVFSFGRQFGVKIAAGVETPLVVPEALKSHLKSKGLSPDSPETAKKLYEGIYDRIMKTYPLDYFWLWTREDWTWAIPQKQEVDKTFNHIDIAWQTLDEMGRPFGFGLCGWVLGPPDNRSAFDNNTPDWVALSCINRHLGFEWVDPGFYEIKKKRPKWVIPWMEDDHAMIQPQFWVGRIRRDAADAFNGNCTGLIGIHWRTRTIAPNISALAQAGWEQKGWNPDFGKPMDKTQPIKERSRDLSTGDFYSDWIRSEFGENMKESLQPVFENLDGGQYIPENAAIANIPRPSTWDIGPGGIRENPEPWESEHQKYAFVDRLKALKDSVKGKGNQERYDYWLAQMNYLQAIGKAGCTRGLLGNILTQLKNTTNETEKVNLKAKLLETRIQLSRDWEDLMTALLETVCTPGEMGNVANLEQHNRNTLQFVTKYDEEIGKLIKNKLPDDVILRKEYQGKPRMIVPIIRTLVSKGEKLYLKAIILDQAENHQPEVYFRIIGKGEYQKLKMEKINKNIYETIIKDLHQEGLEYYIQVTLSNGETAIWPATAPEINHTVLIQ